MKLGIIGVQGAGKTTVFRALTYGVGARLARPYNTKAQEPNVVSVPVPDERLDFISTVFKPKKITYAEIEFIDLPGFTKSTLAMLQTADALVNVIPFFGEFKEPVKYMNEVSNEIVLRDLELCEARLDKFSKIKDRHSKCSEESLELKFLEQCKAVLEKATPLRRLEQVKLGKNELKLIKEVGFISQKPIVLILNRENEKMSDELKVKAESDGLPLIDFNAKLELEIAELNPEERDEYEKEFGTGEPPLKKFIRIGYPGLGIITFFTVVGDEVKAWLLKAETTVLKAAGKVHSDMERGFIRAQVISYNDFKTAGSFKEAKEKGLIRLVNRDHVVKDGDIIEFKFHV
ncbi:MAG: DUF933 domain-containing protein [bacterium]|nr:DUF933 domain-containing protein [bacterium]